MKKKFITYIVLLLAFLLTACNKDYGPYWQVRMTGEWSDKVLLKSEFDCEVTPVPSTNTFQFSCVYLENGTVYNFYAERYSEGEHMTDY